MAKKRYEERLEELIAPVLAENGFELYDTEYVKEGSNWYLRAYIDKPGGITIDDCVLVNHYLSDRLDEEDFISEAYTLEVSSPGLGRQLKKDRHFEKSLGQVVELRFYQPVKLVQDGKEQSVKQYKGILSSFDQEKLVITSEEDGEYMFERSNLALVRLAFDI